MAAPVPKPTNIRELFGNPSKRPLNTDEPQPTQDPYPEPPDWLDPKAKEVWRVIAAELVPLRLLTRIDYEAFGRYCFKVWQWHKLADFIGKNGTVYPVYEEVALVDERGIPVFRDDGKPVTKQILKKMQKFPQFSQMMQLAGELKMLEHEFGMTPSARSRIRIGSDGSVGRNTGAGSGKERFRNYRGK